jgi:ABC-type transport system substrate-binding protein
METSPHKNSLQETIKSLRFKVHTIFKQSWPIDWGNFQDSDLIVKAVSGASTLAKLVVFGCIVGILFSFSLLIYGFYFISTKEAPDQGGEIREAVIDSTMSIFNPATAYISDAEQRVNSLLYLPLYSVSYPNYLYEGKTSPTIEPKLLAKSPEWQTNSAKPEENYKKLKFTLKKDLKWSNGKPISIGDVQYTFDLLKPTESNPGGNPQFKESFRQVTFNPLNDYEFELVSLSPNPQLIYNANFSPISKEYFSGLNIERLGNDNRSVKPLVTSGYFTFTEGNIQDPDSTKNQLIENPIKDSSNNFIKTAILSRNPVQNTSKPVYVDKYIVKTYYSLEDKGGNSGGSLEKAAKEGKIDILSRSIAPSSAISSENMKAKLGLNQVSIPSNTYYNLYLNIKKDQYFINQTLRKYVICEFARLNLKSPFTNSTENLPREKRVLPIQFQENDTQGDCPDDTNSILDTRFYSVTTNENKKTINLYGDPISISLAGVEESEPVLDQIKSYFETIGLQVSDVIKDNMKLEESIKAKNYNAIFLPVTFTSSDPYSIYGASGQNLTDIGQNNKVVSYEVENNLKKYTLSNQTDTTAKNNLVDFFKKEYVSINLFRGKYEVNYSERIKKVYPDVEKNIPLAVTLPSDTNIDFSKVSFKTKRIGK